MLYTQFTEESVVRVSGLPLRGGTRWATPEYRLVRTSLLSGVFWRRKSTCRKYAGLDRCAPTQEQPCEWATRDLSTRMYYSPPYVLFDILIRLISSARALHRQERQSTKPTISRNNRIARAMQLWHHSGNIAGIQGKCLLGKVRKDTSHSF